MEENDMKALIDGDIVVYRSAASAEEEEQWVALARADKLMQDILEDTTATSYQVFLTGSNNFRREIAPSYKAQRPDARPKHWTAVREFLITQHKAMVCNGYEADDEMGIQQDKTHKTTVVCSIDKDLLQIPGRHYNFVKKVFQEVTYEEGYKFLYMQSLIGDRSDNIFGVQGLGPVKAAKALEGLLPEEYYDKCKELYNDDERFHLNMQLLYIWQKPNDMWMPPTASRAAGSNAEGDPTASETCPHGQGSAEAVT